MMPVNMKNSYTCLKVYKTHFKFLCFWIPYIRHKKLNENKHYTTGCDEKGNYVIFNNKNKIKYRFAFSYIGEGNI